eukprot:876805-Prymnesium_polylepis.1
MKTSAGRGAPDRSRPRISTSVCGSMITSPPPALTSPIVSSPLCGWRASAWQMRRTTRGAWLERS